ncbi:DUF4159 domain-containing protein [Paraflavitalea speifideaquila]|uniref:DUF4159 domain-containing protein n=1 Tax=Paraflavitalea speifideaquila TaxID=3076558 RepID=UPI0028EE5DE2|nr:DUF4159 domain-containing protein [Paraflavitalea speifideiaquila]
MNQGNKFIFSRLSYRSGDWDTDQRMPSNLLNSLVEYTTIPVNPQERIIELGSEDIFSAPFCYLSGHKLVQFNGREQANFKKICGEWGLCICR